MDHDKARQMREILAKQVAENRHGMHDPEKFAAPRPGVGESNVQIPALSKLLSSS